VQQQAEPAEAGQGDAEAGRPAAGAGQDGVAEVEAGEQHQAGERVAGDRGGEPRPVVVGQEVQHRAGGERQGDQQGAGDRAEAALGEGDEGDEQGTDQEFQDAVEHVTDPRTDPAAMVADLAAVSHSWPGHPLRNRGSAELSSVAWTTSIGTSSARWSPTAG
jgi:hypothetical protein